MMLTAEEARAKWCPMAAFPLILATPQGQLPVGVGNRGVGPSGPTVEAMDNPSSARCIATRCMAWRPCADGLRGHCGLAGPALNLTN